jgi:hypothetical protein
MPANTEEPATVIDGAGPGIACLAASNPENTRELQVGQQALIEAAIHDGVLRALVKRAEMQRRRATAATSAAGEQFPGVLLRSPEAALASRLAADWEAIADDLETAAQR